MRTLIFLLSAVMAAQLDKTTLGNIKKLTIKSVRNQGALQDDEECFADKGRDEIKLEYESGGQTQLVLNRAFAVNSKYDVGQDFIC